ncbi:MAG: Xaa-Pro peptidase family protein [Oscillospiraceae bacterium]|nr:Xaa-Pro peptidase family protein [Oscillospiraceae bacterium]
MSNVGTIAEWLPDERTAALITSPLSLRYMCGFTIENGILLVFKERVILFVTSRDFEYAVEKADGFSVQVLSSGRQMLDLLIKYSIKRIYTEADKITVAEFNTYKEQLHYADVLASDELSTQLMKMRTIKSDDEIVAIYNAQKICDKAYERLLATVRKGMTERQIAALLGFYIMDYGAEEQAFPAIVLSGENTADQRAKPSDRQIRDGDFLILEFGARWGGYCASMSRTVAVGAIDSTRDNMYNAVSCALQDGLKALRAGIGGKVADSVAKATLNAWGVDKYCSVNFAHGIGLEAVEPPFLRQGSSAMLKAKTALSTACGISTGRFGVKIGDIAVLTEEGCADLTAATKSLVHI